MLVAMIVLAGLVALCVGGSLQVSIPSFADALGAGSAGLGYGLLLFANGAGGVLGGFLLEATGALKPNTKVVVVTTVLFGATTVVVAVTGWFAVAVVALFVGGVANMASTAIGQAVVQLRRRSNSVDGSSVCTTCSAVGCAPATGSRSRSWARRWASGPPSRSGRRARPGGARGGRRHRGPAPACTAPLTRSAAARPGYGHRRADAWPSRLG
ncbi:hypothetical protein P9139_21080 [Curtobacterium flaccumfaciens]|nr:hypothetical protein P9139_21080 [Curtobacterium flaccumfaciens]